MILTGYMPIFRFPMMFPRWARMNHLFLNCCPTLLRQFLIWSHTRFILFMNRYVQQIEQKFVYKNSPLLMLSFVCLVLTVQVGHMIQAESDNTKRDEYLKRLMSLPNQVPYVAFVLLSVMLSLEDSLYNVILCFNFAEMGGNNWTGRPEH